MFFKLVFICNLSRRNQNVYFATDFSNFPLISVTLGLLLCYIDVYEYPYPGRDWGQEEKGMTEDEMAGWHHLLDGHECG